MADEEANYQFSLHMVLPVDGACVSPPGWEFPEPKRRRNRAGVMEVLVHSNMTAAEIADHLRQLAEQLDGGLPVGALWSIPSKN